MVKEEEFYYMNLIQFLQIIYKNGQNKLDNDFYKQYNINIFNKWIIN